MHIFHVGVAGPSNISWLLYTYSSVTLHIEAFPVAQHLKFCYNSEHIHKQTVPLCASRINNSAVAAQQVVKIRLNVKKAVASRNNMLRIRMSLNKHKLFS